MKERRECDHHPSFLLVSRPTNISILQDKQKAANQSEKRKSLTVLLMDAGRTNTSQLYTQKRQTERESRKSSECFQSKMENQLINESHEQDHSKLEDVQVEQQRQKDLD